MNKPMIEETATVRYELHKLILSGDVFIDNHGKTYQNTGERKHDSESSVRACLIRINKVLPHATKNELHHSIWTMGASDLPSDLDGHEQRLGALKVLLWIERELMYGRKFEDL